MKRKFNKLDILNIGIIILTLIVNFMVKDNLPSELAVQINITGEVGNTFSKEFFIFFAPGLMALSSLWLYIKGKDTKLQVVLVNLLFCVVNIFTIYINGGF